MSPIKPENRAKYPSDWPVISREIRVERAGGRCECDGRCGVLPHPPRCEAVHGQPSPWSQSIVVLTTMHLNHDPSDNGTPGNRPNLLAGCQRCHLSYDAEHHAETRAVSRAAAVAELGTLTLFDGMDL